MYGAEWLYTFNVCGNVVTPPAVCTNSPGPGAVIPAPLPPGQTYPA